MNSASHIGDNIAETHSSVQDYYGQQLQSSADLKTSACCDLAQMPNWLKPLLANIHPEVLSRYYGCGLVCPNQLEGCRVLDLGCGSGRDVYALAKLVRSQGEVVVSNCVINLSPDKDTALAAKLGNIRFFSATCRLFKLEELESDCGDYGQAVVYRGTGPNCPYGFALDGNHFIETGRLPVPLARKQTLPRALIASSRCKENNNGPISLCARVTASRRCVQVIRPWNLAVDRVPRYCSARRIRLDHC